MNRQHIYIHNICVVAGATCCECESQPAVVECPKCESSFCQQCYVKVHTHKALRSHQSVPISPNKKVFTTCAPLSVRSWPGGV